MINQDIRDLLPEDAIILEDHAYDNSIIGISESGRVIYDYDKMVEELAADEGWSIDDSEEWISYNTIRALPYAGSDGPIIMFPL